MASADVVVLEYAEIASPNGELLHEAARRRGIRLTQWHPHLLQMFCADADCRPAYNGEFVVPDVIVHRTVALFAGLVVPCLARWGQLGSTILNDPVAAYRTRDKLATTLALQQNKVAVVATLGMIQSAESPVHDVGDGPVIVKPAHGVRGEGIQVFAAPDEVAFAEPAPDSWGEQDWGLYRVREHVVVQPVVGQPGADIRAFVVGDDCVALMRRQARPGEVRANLALGATATSLPLTHDAATVAVAAAQACELDYGGVDLVEDTDGVIRVIEVDAWAGFAGITAATGVDVAGHILDLAVARRRATMTTPATAKTPGATP